jgi:SAM-dependent methyltransferase
MAEAADDWREHSQFRKRGSPQEVSGYCQRRFETSRRLRRLHKSELAFARLLMDLIGPGRSILDVPCGPGRFYEVFSGAAEVTMVDYDPEALKVVQAAHGQDRRLRILQGDIACLPFSDGSFDLVFSMRLLHHIGDEALRRQVVAELARVSRRYVALSLYSKHTFRYMKRRLFGMRPSGNSVALGRFIAEARRMGLRLLRKYPAVSLIEQQRMLLFEKV